MHPAVRIANVLVLASLLCRAGAPTLVLVASSLLALRLRLADAALSDTVRLLWRLRWLGLAVGLVHFWPWWLSDAPRPPLSPVWTGALRNLAALALLVLAVDTLLGGSRREEIVAGLLWWLRPLGAVGERFALRLWLTLELLPGRQEALSSLFAAARPPSAADGPDRQRILPSLPAVLARLLQEAERPASPVPALPPLRIPSAPRPREWLQPVSILTALLLLERLA